MPGNPSPERESEAAAPGREDGPSPRPGKPPVGAAGEEAWQERCLLLERTNEELRRRVQILLQEHDAIEEETRALAERHLQAELHNSDLVILLAAQQRLHSTLSYPAVLGILKEILINILGSESFGIFVRDESNDRLVLATHEGLPAGTPPVLRQDEGLVGEAIRGGAWRLAPPEADLHHSRRPIACVPLVWNGRLEGAIVVLNLLVQKTGFGGLDRELFAILQIQAAQAIRACRAATRLEQENLQATHAVGGHTREPGGA
ncbi:MAG TPA: GAF domain-containing protein [Myxococcota bacterium]|nr:GAF domain-containing protein [Myxococcota bacterium]HRY95220.1 GAF domain-containing protein [Myxococcota bacterium]HSA22334.1 GAF domain-containing protein [Myxococcota bacterium]